MANTYSHTPVLSKVKIGSEVYYVKDADVRAIIDNYGDIVTYDVEATLSNGQNIPTGAAVTTAISNAVSGITGAMHFIGVSTTDPAKGTITITGNADYAPASGDIVLYGTKEFVYDGSDWRELGDEGIYLTTANAQQDYVQKTFTIAGVDMQDNITAQEIKNALGLKALAYKESASGTLTDYATGIDGASYTPAGTVSVTLTDTATSMTSTGNFTPAGTISAPSVSVTPTTKSVKYVSSVGTLPSVTETTSNFATEGLTAAMDETDTEMLVFTTASTGSALTGTGFNAGTLPSLDAEATTVVTGIDSATATAPTFTGTSGSVSVTGSYDKASVDTASFSGTAATITPTLKTGNKTVTVS